MYDLAQETAQAGARATGRAAISVERQAPEEADYLVDNPQRRIADLAKSRRAFPEWTPRVRLPDGLERTFRHHIEMQGR